MKTIKNLSCASFLAAATPTAVLAAVPAQPPLVLHAARLLDVASGRLTSPAEILVEGERITAVGGSVAHPAGARRVDLGDVTLMPGLIDVHVHLFLHPGVDEDMQTVKESVPTRTLLAAVAARDDLMAGFTAERDMGTEGAGSADSAVRDAINSGLLPGPRLCVSGNAMSILGGHEDAIHFNPDIHMPSNATYANDTAELTAVIRQQHKEGSDFVKIYETGHDEMRNGTLAHPLSIHTGANEGRGRRSSPSWRQVAVHAKASPARCTPRRPAWPPSIMPRS